MGDPIRVSVIAVDPVLEVGATSALLSCSDIVAALPWEMAKVAVVIVDAMVNQVFDLVRAQREMDGRPEVVLVAADFAPAEALHATRWARGAWCAAARPTRRRGPGCSRCSGAAGSRWPPDRTGLRTRSA
jgi:hypothetical protein